MTDNSLSGGAGEAGSTVPEIAESDGRLLRVLVVEDNENDAELILHSLRRSGIRVEALRVEAETALREALEDRVWDLVLADFAMPCFDGPSALRIVRHYDPDLPFILVSGAACADSAAASIAAGANDAIGKDALVRLLPVVERELRLAAERRRLHRESLHAQEVEAALKDSESRFLQLAENIPECFWLYDVGERRVVFVNAAFERIWGEPLASLCRNPDVWWERAHPDDLGRLREAAERARFGGLDEDLRIVRGDGVTRWVHVRTFPIRDEAGVIRSVGGVASDVTRGVEQQLQVQRLARFDSLTALPNRLLFHERLAAAMALAKRNHWRLAVLFIDLDRFKNVNDTLGHGAGDELLRQVALRLKACLRDSDTVSRLGGDEFAVVLPDLESNERAAIVAGKIVDAVAMPFVVSGEEVFVSASIGIALYPDDAAELDHLVRYADTAMYRAKEAGRSNYQFFTGEMNQRARARMVIESELRRALPRQQYVLHYQPKLDCRSGRIVGAEALLRWNHPGRGLVSPVEFIPVLEDTLAIVEVGAWVLEQACRQARAWREAGLGLAAIAVNVSGRQLQAPGFVGVVRAALAASGLGADGLELELTESVLMHDAAAVAAILAELKAMGVRLAVDDFGTGYSSLAYLKRFPLDCLKVDRAFVRDICDDVDDASITRAIINIGHELGLEVVAEGVETAAQLQLLRLAGCEQIQGYLLSPPLPATDFESLLRRGHGLELDALPGATAAAMRQEAVALRQALGERHRQDEFAQERQRLQRSCAAAHDLMHALVDEVPTPILGIDDGGMVAFANFAAEKLLAAWLPLVGMDAVEVLPASLQAFLAGAAAGDSAAEPEIVVGRWRGRVRLRELGDGRGRVLSFIAADDSERTT